MGEIDELSNLEQCLLELQRKEIENVHWAGAIFDGEEHEKYIIAMWFGLDKEEAYRWIEQ